MQNIYVRFLLLLTARTNLLIYNQWQPSGGILEWQKADAVFFLEIIGILNCVRGIVRTKTGRQVLITFNMGG